MFISNTIIAYVVYFQQKIQTSDMTLASKVKVTFTKNLSMAGNANRGSSNIVK